MYNIATLNKISPVGLSHLSDKYTVCDDVSSASGILVRSQDMHEMEFSRTFWLSQEPAQGQQHSTGQMCRRGIVVFNAPGSQC